jgi:hypothetical protein
MQAAYLNALAARFCDVVLDKLKAERFGEPPPHPEITNQLTTASAIDGPWRWRRGALQVIALYMLSELLLVVGSFSCTGRPVTGT